MAGASDSSSKEDKSESRRDRAVTRYLVPILVAWLLAVGGLLGWTYTTSEIIALGGKLAVVASAGLAFLAVILAAVQDALPVGQKQRLLFPKREFPYPSFQAFSDPDIIDAASIADDPDGLEGFEKGFPKTPKDQDKLWYAAFKRHVQKFEIAQFSARHIVWRDAVPLLVFLGGLTPFVGWAAQFSGGVAYWKILAGVCLGLAFVCWLAGRSANEALVVEVLKALGQEAAQARKAPSN